MASGIPSESTSAGDLGDPDAHNGVTGLSRVTIDHLVANYYHTEESKELGAPSTASRTPTSSTGNSILIPLSPQGRG